jgi:hypothetical protein
MSAKRKQGFVISIYVVAEIAGETPAVPKFGAS